MLCYPFVAQSYLVLFPRWKEGGGMVPLLSSPFSAGPPSSSRYILMFSLHGSKAHFALLCVKHLMQHFSLAAGVHDFVCRDLQVCLPKQCIAIFIAFCTLSQHKHNSWPAPSARKRTPQSATLLWHADLQCLGATVSCCSCAAPACQDFRSCHTVSCLQSSSCCCLKWCWCSADAI